MTQSKNQKNVVEQYDAAVDAYIEITKRVREILQRVKEKNLMLYAKRIMEK